MSDIDDVKSRLNIADIIGDRVTLKKAGRNLKGLCPFHNEKTPSFMVSPERQTFHCFGCGKGGSVIDFVMEYEHVDFGEALETLAEKAGVKLDRRMQDTPEAKLKTRILEANHLASEYYHFLLTKHRLGEKARNYLAERGVSEKTAKTFMLGYSPNSWDGLLKFLRKKGYDEGLLATAGLIIKSARGGYDRFRGRVMFALRDHRGNVVGFSGRLLDKNAKEAKYINTSETPVYIKGNMLYGLDVTKNAIQKENEAIVMEGEFDVISSFQAGVGNVVAIKGSALTEGHVNLIRRFTDRLVFALDSDMAGDAASRRGIEIAEKAGLDLRVVEIPQGKDPDESVRENAAIFKKAVKDAVPYYDYLIDSALRRFDVTSPYGKKKISDELMPSLSVIENSVVQAHYIKKVAKIMDVGEEVITTSLKKVKSSIRQKAESATAPSEIHLRTREEKIEIYILAFILQIKTAEYLEELEEHLTFADFTQAAIRQILELLSDYLKQEKVFLIKDFDSAVPKELIPVIDEAFLWDLSELVDNEELAAREWLKALAELRLSVLKRKIRRVTNLLDALGHEEEEEMVNLQAELASLTGELRVLEKTAAI
jgi:DNA primase